MRRRLVSMLLVLAMVLTLLPVQAFAAGTAAPFRDVPRSSWYYDSVQYVCANGLFNGTSADTFSPGDNMTRGMFVTVLGRMAGVDPEKYTGPSQFTDVPESAYYAPYVMWATRYGITTGTGEGKFSPGAYINRQQMAVFFVRYFEAFDVDYDTGANITGTPADIDSVSAYAKDAVLKLWRQGLLNGNGRAFDPFGNATRAQAATICYRTDDAVDTWYSEPGVPSTRVRIDPATGLPYGESGKPNTSKPSSGGSSGGSGGGGGGGTTPTPSDSYAVNFYDGSKLIKTLYAKKGEPLGQLPTVAESSKANYILEGYYTDSNFTTPFYAENPVTGTMSVYARYESMGDMETLTVDSFARMDQQPNVSFRFKALDGTADSLNAAKAAVTLAVKDGTDPVVIEVSGSGTYTVSAPAGFNKGCSYELNLAEGWTFLPDGSDTIPSEAIRTAAFSIEMAEVENLSMNEGIRYVKDTDQINYTYTDKDNKSYSNVAELASDADFTKGGSFNYSDTDGWEAGDILCIYVGGKPDSDDAERTEEAVYAKVSSISNGTVNFTPLAEEDRAELYNVPDNFPIQVASLPTETTGTVSITALDATLYAQMMGTTEGTLAKAKEKLAVGDFVSLYVSADSINSESDVYFGRVTAVSGETITYEKCTAQDIEDSADLYTKVEMSGEDLITPEQKAEIEQTVLAQVEQSNFGEDAAWMLLDMASQTDGFKNTAGLQSVLFQDEAGNELSAESVSYLARSARNVGTKFELGDDVELKVELITSGDQLHFRNEGVQLAIGVSAEFEVDTADDGKVHINLSATFVQEVAVDPSIKGQLVYKEILFIPVPTGVQVNAIVDVKSFTAMSIKAEIFTEGAEDKGLWEKFQDFAKDPTALGDIPGLPDGIREGMSTVGDALKKIDEIKEEISKQIEDLPGYDNATINAIWEQIQAVTNGSVNREEWESIGENLEKTDITDELMNLMNLTSDTDLSTEYIEGLSALMDRYSELMEKETDWVTLVEKEMFNRNTPEKFGVIIGIQGKFMVRADLNLAIGSNLQYEVGKRYNFWFRIGLFKPTSGSSTMDLLDESFAFQFYVMGKMGIKAGVRLKLYAAIGSVDAISVGLTTELGPYLKLWGFFIYDYSKYRPANTTMWTHKEQMAGALYLEFGLYLMVGVEAKALFLEYDKDFVDKEYPLLDAGDKIYYYAPAYEPIDDEDVIVVGWENAITPRPDSVVSTLLPDEIRSLEYIDLTTGKQGTNILDFDNYTFKLSNPNFKVEAVDGHLVASVISIPQNVNAMDCDLTITYKHGKLAFSNFDMSATVHLTWNNLTAEDQKKIYTASVTIPDGNGGLEVVWSRRMRPNTLFSLPTEAEIRKLLSWSDAKYAAGSGYGSQPTENLTLNQNTQYHYDLSYQTYQLTVTGIQPGNTSQTFTGKYGEPFDFSSLLNTGTDGPGSYTRFAGLMMDGKSLALNQPINGVFVASNNAAAVAQYDDETVTATFEFTGFDHEDIDVTLRRGDTPGTAGVLAAVPSYLSVTGFYPEVGPMDGDMTYQVVCEAPAGSTVTVTFNANGGSESAAMSRPTGSILGALPTPTRTGYSFDGWFTDDGTFQNPVDANTVVTGPMTLYAKWTVNNITVTFNANGGLLTGDGTKTAAFGQPYGELPTAEKNDGETRFGFLGWFTEQDSGEKVTAETVVAAMADHTLYAHWGELKTIPRTVFTFGEPKTVTYNGVDQTADFTFTPEEGAAYTQGSFKFDYIRQPDEILAQAVSRGEAATTGGKYNVRITREEDETYAKFQEEYQNVLIVERINVDLSSITADDVSIVDRGYTWAQVKLNDGVLEECLKDLPETIDRSKLYPIWQVEVLDNNYYKMEYSDPEMPNGFLYDLKPGQNGIYLRSFSLANSGDNTNFVVTKPAFGDGFSLVYTEKGWFNSTYWAREPYENAKRSECLQLEDADKTWYQGHEDEDFFTISTARELAYFSQLVYEGNTFEGKTVTLGADIDLGTLTITNVHGITYFCVWVPIGAYLSSIGTIEYGSSYSTYFMGTFDGGGHTITGMFTHNGGLFGKLQNATIKNLTLEDSYIGSSNHEENGGIAGYLDGTIVVENCTSTVALNRLTNEKLNSRYFGTDTFDWTRDDFAAFFEALHKTLPNGIRKSCYVEAFSS